jgi:spore maturation protein CgeB
VKIVILGLSITSSWGNGHATTYRGLVKGLAGLGHDVLFLEREQPWYAAHRDLPSPPYGRTELYYGLTDLKNRFQHDIQKADLVIVGSYVPQGVAVGEWVLATANGAAAFYDIDTPVTLAKLDRGDTQYLSRALVMRYDLYLSFTGGPTLDRLEKRYYSPRARALYCSVDTLNYFPEKSACEWDLGYLGTYSEDRQPALDRLMLKPAAAWPAGRFIIAGPLYPEPIDWPANVARIDHVAPSEHRSFYNSQRFTLNLTRADMVRSGYSPSVRLFEAAACGTPVISDYWDGLGEIFRIGEEILVARTAEESLSFVRSIPESERISLGRRAMDRVLREHTAEHRAAELERYAYELLGTTERSASSRA